MGEQGKMKGKEEEGEEGAQSDRRGGLGSGGRGMIVLAHPMNGQWTEAAGGHFDRRRWTTNNQSGGGEGGSGRSQSNSKMSGVGGGGRKGRGREGLADYLIRWTLNFQ